MTWRSPRLRAGTLTLLSLASLTGCATTTGLNAEPAAPPPARFTFCAVASPIYWDDADTDETIRQVKAHNATWVALCQQ